MLNEILEKITDEKKRNGVPNFVIRNFLKEYLQYPVLNFIYNSPDYKNFIFTGGSCLRICFGAPRLSEDLDFDLLEKDYEKFNINKLAEDLISYFNDKFFFEVAGRCQGNSRIYLKFPVLKRLQLASQEDSNFLYVKIEPNKTEFKNVATELTPISNYGFNFIINNYSLSFLMAGKLNAILGREWFKGKENEVDIKGRDFYDLFWYLENKIRPDFKNLKEILGISNEIELKAALNKRIEKVVTAQKLAYDLKNFFPDQVFVSEFCKNYKKIIGKFLES